jgi:hypothetical protein
LPKHEFEASLNDYHSGRYFHTASRWSRFVAQSLAHTIAI